MSDCKDVNHAKRALVLAPFFSISMNANRPLLVAKALSEIASVEVVTTDFDHSTRKKRHGQMAPIEEIIYVSTPRYFNNIGFARLYSHLMFSVRAALWVRKRRDRFDIVYMTLPFNIVAWCVLRITSARLKIVDVVDIWPDVLPFPPWSRVLLAPLFGLWKWFFKSSVSKADVLMAVSDRFIQEASRYASPKAGVKRFYIGQERLASAATKQPIFTVAFVGNLGHLYDFDTLLDVLAAEDVRDRVQFFLIGEGDRRNWLIGELERRLIKYRYFSTVFEPARLADILRSCNVGFNGYIRTTAAFSYKATTYFAAGLPIINSMTGDLNRLVAENGVGENYEGGNREQLRKCFLRLMQNGTTVMAANCERIFSSYLESSRIGTDMKEFLVARLKYCEDSPISSAENGVVIK